MQGGKNWILRKEINANWFFQDSHWLENWKNHLCPSMGPNEGSVAMDSGDREPFNDYLSLRPVLTSISLPFSIPMAAYHREDAEESLDSSSQAYSTFPKNLVNTSIQHSLTFISQSQLFFYFFFTTVLFLHFW
jgi:hypothetical protein